MPHQELSPADRFRGDVDATPAAASGSSRWARVATRAGWMIWFAVTLLTAVTSTPPASLAPGAVAPSTWMVVLGALPLAAVDTLTLFAAVRLTRRFLIGWERLGESVAVHAAAAVALAVASYAVEKVVAPWVPSAAQLSWPTAIVLSTGFYALLAGAVHAVEYARRYRRLAAAGLHLRAELGEAGRRRAEAELRALKAELNPHFLGNALHVVATLVHTDPAGAERVLGQLDDLLRKAVARAHTQEVTLEEELAELEPFLDVERARLGGGGGLAVEWDLDSAALGARVPHLILQPLVENAVRHGLAPQGGGRITIAARRTQEDALELTVTDDGIGLSTPADGPATRHKLGRGVGLGVGLANTRARLSELYGSTATLALTSVQAGGATARLVLPWGERRNASPASGDDAAGGESESAVGGRRHATRGATDRIDGATRARVALALWFAGVWVVWTNISLQLPLEDGRAAPFASALVEGFQTAVLWTALVYTAVRATRRFPVGRRAAWRHMAVHVSAAASLAVAMVVSKLLVSYALGYPLPVALAQRLAGVVVATMGFYALLAGVAHAVEYAWRYRRTEAAGLRLRAALGEAGRRRAEAELRALKAELNPQLLNSAVRTAASLVRSDPDAAVRVLGQLGTMMRDALLRTRVQEVTLEEELAGLEPFLQVARAPTGAQLPVEWDVDPAALGARVPHLILQPLVESALRNAATLGAPGWVKVVARRAGARLEVEVTDGGAPDPPMVATGEPSPVGDAGVANARARLAELYGAEAELALEAVRGGAVARLVMPFLDDDEPGRARG